MKLLMDGVGRIVEAAVPTPRRLELWRTHEGLRKKFGEAVEKAARDLTAVQAEANDLAEARKAAFRRVRDEAASYRERLMKEAERDNAEFETIKREVLEWLSIEGKGSIWCVQRRIAELKAECSADARVEKVEAALSSALRSARSATQALEAIVSRGTA